MIEPVGPASSNNLIRRLCPTGPGPEEPDGQYHAGVSPPAGGVVTFLFTDLVGSTLSLAFLGDDAAEELRHTHFGLIRQAVAEFRGEEVKNLGDGLMASFVSAVDALGAAVAIQKNVAEYNRGGAGPAMAIRIGVHAGEAVQAEGDFFGTPVVVAKRLCDAAEGGQILTTEVLADLVGTRGGFKFRPMGRLPLKGLPRKVAAVAVEWTTPELEPLHRNLPERAPARRRRGSGNRGLRLVGRAGELEILESELAQAGAGELRCVLLVGEPGVGKTRLADELSRRHGEDVITLWARGHPLGAGIAFGLWAEALEPVLASFSDDEVAAVCGGFLDDLASLSHRVAAVRGSAPPGDAPRFRMLGGLAGVLGALSIQTPVVVVLDDVHLADASSWEALRYLARHLDDARILVVATARTAELATHEMASQVLFELDQDALLTRLDVSALGRSEVRDLAEVIMERPAPPALVEWLTERSQGNALFAIGLVRALLEESADLSAPRLRRLPEGLAERVAARIRRSDDKERQTLELLAVAGRPVTLGDLTRLTGMTLEEFGPVIEALVAARVVVEAERGREVIYEVAHPLIRDLIYEGIGGARRRALHRQFGRAVHGAGRLAEAALHFARSAEPGEAEAVGVLLEALHQAEHRESYREALTLLAELVELLSADDERWLAVGDAMAWGAEWLVEHRADSHAPVALAALRNIDRLLERSPDLSRRASVKLRQASFLAWGTGELAEARQAAEAAVRMFREAGKDQQALLAERELAWASGLAGDFSGMGAESERIAAAAAAAGDRFLEMQALHAFGYSAGFRGEFRAAERSQAAAAEIARQDGKIYRLTTILVAQAAYLSLEGRTADARVLLDRAREQNPSYRDTVLLEMEALTLWLAGEYPRGLDAAREAVAWVPTGVSLRRLQGFTCGAMCAIEAGDPGLARQLVTRAKDGLAGRDWSIYSPLAGHARALIDWHEGDLPQAVTGLRTVADRFLAMGAHAWVAATLVDLAEAAFDAADLATARRAGDDMAATAAVIGAPLHRGLAALAAAWTGLTEGNCAGAAANGERAIELLAGTGWRGHLARAHAVMGRALGGLDRSRALSALQEAVSTFETCGATWRRGRTVAVLASLGSSGRRAAAAALGPGSLSRRELDVARLAARGLSTKEIAEALFVGGRTVESHLGRVYAKLGVESRLELVRRAGELGLS